MWDKSRHAASAEAVVAPQRNEHLNEARPSASEQVLGNTSGIPETKHPILGILVFGKASS